MEIENYNRLADILLIMAFLGFFLILWVGHMVWRRFRQRPQRSRYLPPTVYRFPQHGPKLSRALRKPRGWK